MGYNVVKTSIAFVNPNIFFIDISELLMMASLASLQLAYRSYLWAPSDKRGLPARDRSCDLTVSSFPSWRVLFDQDESIPIPMNIRNSNTIVTFKSYMDQPINTWEQTQTFLLIFFFDLRQFLHTICCDKRCDTNQLEQITIMLNYYPFWIIDICNIVKIIYCKNRYCSMFKKWVMKIIE